MAAVNMNGGYAPHQGYANMDNQQGQHNGAYTAVPPYQQSAPASTPGASTSQTTDIPKDEVGWYFVEQYYTTLSRNPEKLYLFYNKRSQFVSGQEADKVSVCVGQRAINDKIKELDFQDGKVRVTNVDSQASDSNIVIQVIGELSNRSQPHKKFVQTFVLATQTNGYFVLNDVFRYLVEEEEEEETEQDVAQEEAQQAPAAETVEHESSAPSVETTGHKALTSSSDPSAIEAAAKVVDQELQEKVIKADNAPAQASAAATTNGDSADDQTPAASEAAAEDVATDDSAAQQPLLSAEKPRDPEPTPVQSPPKQAAQPAAPVKPAAPKTWATLAAAANRVATPVNPAQAASQPRPATNAKPQPTPAAAAAATAQTADSVTPSAVKRDESPASVHTDEWTAVGGSHARQQSRQVNTQPETASNRGYIKNVSEAVDGKELRSQLEKFGEVSYLDISRQKNCAFVDFKTAEGYNAAVAANPHVIGSERLFVEERRVRTGGQFGPSQRGNFQGPRGGRGAANQSAPRGNFQNARGGASMPARGGSRGGASTPRGGRGGAPAAA